MYFLRVILSCLVIIQARAQLDAGFLETAKNTFQYLEELNYPYENHTVTTQDGYELLLVRILSNGNVSSTSSSTRPPILFVHGILANFNDYLVTGPGISFGFEALERGYDVFLLNVRGNRWSRNHVTLDPDTDREYWDFSWHEIGIYDLPASIDYITNLTGYSTISYVGHSQGTTSLLVLASSRPEYNEKVRVAILISPVAYLTNAQTSLAVLLKNQVDFVEDVADTLQIDEILPYSPLVSETLRLLCSPNSAFLDVCIEFISSIVGPSTQTNRTLLSAYITNYPSGAATKQFIHYLQNAKEDTFRQFDYGEEQNIIKYGQAAPPDYDLSEVTIPIAMYFGANDYLVAITDELKLSRRLPNVITNVLLSFGQVNHLDVIIGTRAKALVTQPALNILNRYNNL